MIACATRKNPPACENALWCLVKCRSCLQQHFMSLQAEVMQLCFISEPDLLTSTRLFPDCWWWLNAKYQLCEVAGSLVLVLSKNLIQYHNMLTSCTIAPTSPHKLPAHQNIPRQSLAAQSFSQLAPTMIDMLFY